MNLQPFLLALEVRLNEYKNRMELTYFDSYQVTSGEGLKYFKVFKTQIKDGKEIGSRDLVAFVDREGNIYKPASFAAPAKHSRGNINSEFHGMEAIDPSGFVKYLK